MSAFGGLFVSEKFLRFFRYATWAVITAGLLTAAAVVGSILVQEDMRAQNRRDLAAVTSDTASVISTLDLLNQQLADVGCSPESVEEMRRIAFLPDGIHEINRIEGSALLCSAGKGLLADPIELGRPDAEIEGTNDLRIWWQRPLDIIGYPGIKGTFVGKGAFVVVAPIHSDRFEQSAWFARELVLALPEGKVFHRLGIVGLYNTLAERSDLNGDSWWNGAFRRIDCDNFGVNCIAAAGTLAATANAWSKAIIVTVLALAGIGYGLAGIIDQRLRRFWSFERRFIRNLAEGVECVYQPVVSIRSGQVVGCEVLARWRDVDGRLHFPNAFIGIVDQAGLTRAFTREVVAKALRELDEALPAKQRLQVNFNIFPRDFDFETLRMLLDGRSRTSGRFDIAVEIIETEDFDKEAVKREIVALGAIGVRTYIDDFGAGYSNIASLASLPLDGVKLDKSFALAQDDSLLARMLPFAVDLVASAGHKLIVEGVESQGCLDGLRQNPHVDLVQGFHIAKPMPIRLFAAWIEARAQAHNAADNGKIVRLERAKP